MKKITVFILFATIQMFAQQHFPGKRPELLIGKEVTVVPTIESAALKGQPYFYSDRKTLQTYLPSSARSSYTDPAIEGKKFKVTSVEPVVENSRPYMYLSLEAEDKSTLYYKYSPTMAEFSYPFEVTGGLTVPADFYCDFVEKNIFGTITAYDANVGIGMKLSKRISDGKTSYTLHITTFIESEGKTARGAVLVLENNKKIATNPDLPIVPTYQSGKSYKYMHGFELSPKDVELLKSNKVLGLRLLDKVVPITTGVKIQGVLSCMTKLN
jgi:hypothetical protein